MRELALLVCGFGLGYLVARTRFVYWTLRLFDCTPEQIEIGRRYAQSQGDIDGWCWTSTNEYGEASRSVEEALKFPRRDL